MKPPDFIEKMPVLSWTRLVGLPIPCNMFPGDVVKRWKKLEYAVICLVDYRDEDSKEYYFLLCDKNWNVHASDLSYNIDGAKEALEKELMLPEIILFNHNQEN